MCGSGRVIVESVWSCGQTTRITLQLSAYGDSMRKYARSRRKLAKAGRPSENMHAARRCDGCENMQTVTNTVLGSQSFTSSDKRQSSPHPNFLLLTACRLSDYELSTRENLRVVQGISVRVLVGRVSYALFYGACLRKCAFPTPAE